MGKQSVLDHLTRARAALLVAIEGLSETEMTTLPVAGVWTIKDILAHISGWAAWDLVGIRAILTGERPNFLVIQDVDAFNARLVAERSTWSLEQILAEMRDTQSALQELLISMPDEDLFRAGLFQGSYWDNLTGWLQVAWEHEEEHAAQIWAWRRYT
ncbi:MAG: DinB family protein [Chloroflexota bacterium]|nr:DinB family protein [Chloroflexota bacterium]